MANTGEVFIRLKRPCPWCQGILERYEAQAVAGQPPSMATPRVRCSSCGRDWDSIQKVIIEAYEKEGKIPPPKVGKGLSLTELRGLLSKVKVGVRAGRNVASSVKAVSEYLASITGRVRTLEKAPDKQEVIAQVGQDVEGIVDQVMLAMDHIAEAKQGNLGPEPEIKGEDDGQAGAEQ